MPEEIESAPAVPAPVKLVKGRHTSATMKAHLARKARVALPNGESVTIQASGIIFNGSVITDPKDVPTDAEIEAVARDVQSRRSPK